MPDNSRLSGLITEKDASLSWESERTKCLEAHSFRQVCSDTDLHPLASCRSHLYLQNLAKCVFELPTEHMELFPRG